MAFLFKEQKKLKHGKITYLKIAEKIKKYKDDGAEYWTRKNIKTIGVLMNGRKPSSHEPNRNYITLKQAKFILNEYNLNNNNNISHESRIPKTIGDLYNSFLPVYKRQKCMDYYNGLKITNPERYDSYDSFISAIESGKFRLSAIDILKQRLNHILPLISSLQLQLYDIDTSNQILEHLHLKNISKSTQSKIFIELKRLFKYAFQKKYINSIPELPKIQIQKTIDIKLTDTYSDEDIKRMLDYANEDQSFLIHIYIETGMRPEEGAYLSLNPKAKTYCDLHNKIIIIKSSRSNKRGRTIPLSKHLEALIHNRLLLNKVSESGQLNPYAITYSKHSPTVNQGRAFKRLCLKSKMNEKHKRNCLKMLRATVNTRLINKMSIELRNQYLGHSESIGRDHYTGSLIQQTRSILDKESLHICK